MVKFNVGDKVEVLRGTFEGYFGKIIKAKEHVCEVTYREYTDLVVEVHTQTPTNQFGGAMATLSCFDGSVQHMQSA